MSKPYGLVICGGKSSRMGTDKSLLNYHGQPQRYHLYEQMKPLCERVFISCNESQAYDIPSEYEVLEDLWLYGDIGPMAALLTAFRRHPDKAFIVVGCDYPFFSVEQLQQLSEAILQIENAVAFYNEDAKLYEPLLAGYQPNMKSVLELNFSLNLLSLNRILKEVDADIIVPENKMSICSIDTYDEYEKAMMQLCIAKNTNAK